MAKRSSKPKTTPQPQRTPEPEPQVPALPADSETVYLYNEDTGELRLAITRIGYAPAPMPFGFRLAKPSEIPAK